MLQAHNGTSLVDVPLYIHNGTEWVTGEYYAHNGTEWVKMVGKQTYTKTWTAVWSQPYDEDNSKRDGSKLWQGWNGTAYHGSQRSLIGFDTGQIKKELEGATITSCTVKFYSEHSWYSAGCTYRVGYHNHSSAPTTFSHTKSYQHDVLGGKPSWASFSAKALAEGIRDGNYKGISFYVGSSKDQNYYGYVSMHSATNAPTITITYEK